MLQEDRTREELLAEIRRLEGLEKECQAARKALQESEEFFRLQFLSNDSIKLVLERASGEVIEANQAACDFFGISRREVLGKKIADITSIPHDQISELLDEAAEKDHAHNIQFSLLRRDGTRIETFFSTIPFTFQGEPCLLTLINYVTDHNHDLEALRISDERFKEALRCSRHVLYRRNVRTDNYDYISPFIEELSGYPADQFRRYGLKEITELIHPDDRDQVVSRIEETGRSHRGVSAPVKLEYRFLKADGEYCWLNDWTTICYDEQGQIESMVGSVYDVTERKKAELELREREERLRVIFETSHSGILMVDNRGFISFANSRMAEMFGRPLAELIGSYYPDYLHPSDFQTCLGMMQQMISGELSQVLMEKRYLRKDGSSFWGYLSARRLEADDGSLQALVGIITDITARKEAEEALMISESRYRHLVELSPEAIFILESNKLVFANLGGVKLLGADCCEQLYGREVLDFVHPDYRETVRKRIENLRSQEEPNPLAELLLVRLDGSFVPVESTSVAFDYFGRQAALSVVRDISERKKMQDELLKAQKLESLGVLAAGIAHDFNNLLTGITGNLSLARMQIDPSLGIVKRLDECEKAAMRARELTHQLLTFARGGEPVRKLFDPDRMIRSSASFMLAGSNVRCVTELATDLWSLEADEGQLSQTLNNLLLNAAQAMPGGGEVTLRGSNMTIPPENPHNLPPGTYIRIEVEDQGCGIPRENLDRIFDPYFTTKQKGNGLGLTSAYSIVRRHGGSIEVSSTPGVGSCITLYLPAVPRQNDEYEPMPEAAPSGRGRILIMDDEELIRKIASEILNFLGYESEECADGREALERYRTAKWRNAPFDAVILDLTVPGGMGGKLAAPLLREIDHDAVLIVSSGYSDDPVIAKYQEYGFNASIPKPFDAATLARELSRLIPKIR